MNMIKSAPGDEGTRLSRDSRLRNVGESIILNVVRKHVYSAKEPTYFVPYAMANRKGNFCPDYCNRPKS